MQNDFPFQPIPTASNTIVAAVSTGAVQLSLPTGPANAPASILLTNEGNQTIFWAYGSVTPVSASSSPILAGTSRVYSYPPGITKISAIAIASGSALYATVGT